MESFIVAIDLGGTTSKMALVTSQGQIKDKWAIDTDIQSQGQFIVDNIIKSIQSKLNELNLSKSQMLGIGMGSPGSVDIEAGTVIGAYNLNWTTLQRVKDAFESAFDILFVIDNDANVAALGEQWLGAGDNDDHVVMITLGTGVGGGIVINGEILQGAYGSAGEIGHLTIDPHSPFLCTCGKKGCLESMASATGVLNLAKYLLKDYQGETVLTDYLSSENEITSEIIFTEAEKGDTFCQMIVDHFAKNLGLACSHITNMLNPSKIILGGGVSNAGDFLKDQVKVYMEGYTFPAIRNQTKIVLAKLGNDAGVIGAAKLVINQLNK